MAPSGDSAYASAGSGKLKLKGVKDAKVDKKKKKKSSKPKDNEITSPQMGGEKRQEEGFLDRSVVLRKLEEEDEAIAEESRSGQSEDVTRKELDDKNREVVKTEAERRYEEQRRKRLEERLKRECVKTHKERVEELNRYLSGLSEHHDMPRIGPG